MAFEYPDVPEYFPDQIKLFKRLIVVIKNLMHGRSNNAFAVTLTANSATTTVTLSSGSLGQDSLIFFMPQTANAATEFGAGSMYVSARSVQTGGTSTSTFTITHANNAQTDRTFGYIVVG